MKKRQVGRSGLWVSAVGLGTNNFALRPDIDVSSVVAAALDNGVILFDTAESYGDGISEQRLGSALGARRHEAVIATKWGTTRNPPPGTGSRDYIMRACERSLRHLGTDYIDIYQMHATDPATPIEETVRACDDLQRQGKIRYYGLSGASAWQMVEAQLVARELGAAPFVATEDHYSLLKRDVVEGERLAVMEKYGLGLLPFFPLAGGLLTGKYDRGKAFPDGSRFAVLDGLGRQFTTERMWDLAEAYSAMADQRGHTVLELAMSWLLHQPIVSSVIAGATRPEQVEANSKAAQWALTAEDLAEIDRIAAR